MTDLWYDIPNTHKRYNGFDNEWDICMEFDPSEPEFVYSEDLLEIEKDMYSRGASKGKEKVEEGEEGEVFESKPHKLTEIGPMPPQPKEFWRDDIVSVYGEGVDHEDETTPKFSETLDQIVYERYGYDCDEAESTSFPEVHQEEWKKFGANLIMDDCSRVIGKKGPLLKFFAQLLDQPAEHIIMPWDLSSQSKAPLRRTIGQHININLHTIDGKVMYVIRPATHTPGPTTWELVVEDPITALQCLRRFMPDVISITRYLISRGIPCNTFLPRMSLERLSVPTHPSIPLSLGIRPRNYIPDAADYSAYQAIRDDFLRQPRGRAALLKGGIIWRLAMEYVDPGRVIAGPTGNSVTGHTLRFPNNHVYCDDNLTEDELDLICGVYKVYTGKKLLHCLKYIY